MQSKKKEAVHDGGGTALLSRRVWILRGSETGRAGRGRYLGLQPWVEEEFLLILRRVQVRLQIASFAVARGRVARVAA